MVLPLVAAGAVGLAAFFGFTSLVAVLAEPVAMLAGLATGGILLQRLLENDPIDELSSGIGRLTGYGSFAATTGFLTYRIGEALFAATGFALGAGVLALIVAVPFIGGSAIAAGIGSVARFGLEVYEAVSR